MKTKISNSLNREHCKTTYIESEQNSLTYSTLTQASSETPSGRKKARTHPWLRKLFVGASQGTQHIIFLDKTQF